MNTATIIALARRFWPIIWPVMAVIAVGIALIAWGNSRHEDGRASRDPEVATLIEQRDTARENVATLEAAVARQSAAIADMGERARKAQERAGEALARAVAADKAAASLRARADKLAKVAPVGVCESPEGDALSRDAWGKL